MADLRARALPESPSLDQYRKQAKELLRAHRDAEAEALARLRLHLPRLAGRSDAEIARASLALADCQRVIAREHGFASWPKLKRRIELVTGEASRGLRPFASHMAPYSDRAGSLLRQLQAGEPAARVLLRANHPRFAEASDEELTAASLSADDARLVFARRHGFESWEELRELVESGHPVAQGDLARARRAVEQGDAARLAGLLRESPALVNAIDDEGRTLLHLAVGEGRAPAIRLLLDAGAPVNAARAQDGWTPLHQAGYAHPPAFADGQHAAVRAVELLLAAGADPTREARGAGGTPLLMALFWGHATVAERLARASTEPGNLRVAAGLGRDDLLRDSFGSDGRLRPRAGRGRGFHRVHDGFPVWRPSEDPQEILDEALSYACRNGRLDAARELSRRGADVNGVPWMCPPLHWMMRTRAEGVVRWLVESGADVDRRADFGGMRGLSALHLAIHQGNLEMVRLLVDLGADVRLHDEMQDAPPLGWARHFEAGDIVAFLESAGA